MSKPNQSKKRSGTTTPPPTTTKPPAVEVPAAPAAGTAATAAAAAATARPTVHTPWGTMDLTDRDQRARDPFEPEAPVAKPAAATVRPKPTGPRAVREDDVAPLSPRELYEMMLTPAAHPVRPSLDKLVAGKVDARKGSSRATPSVTVPPPPAKPSRGNAAFPPGAEMVLSALEAGRAQAPAADRRGAVRRPYRATVVLRLFSDQPGTPAWVLHTRDVHARGLGFITERPLPLGYGGTVELPDPAGGDATIEVPCTLLRCRQAAPGWYEGSLTFNREQPGIEG